MIAQRSAGRHPIGIAVHHAMAVGDHVVEMLRLGLDQIVAEQRRRAWETRAARSCPVRRPTAPWQGAQSMSKRFLAARQHGCGDRRRLRRRQHPARCARPSRPPDAAWSCGLRRKPNRPHGAARCWVNMSSLAQVAMPAAAAAARAGARFIAAPAGCAADAAAGRPGHVRPRSGRSRSERASTTRNSRSCVTPSIPSMLNTGWLRRGSRSRNSIADEHQRAAPPAWRRRNWE